MVFVDGRVKFFFLFKEKNYGKNEIFLATCGLKIFLQCLYNVFGPKIPTFAHSPALVITKGKASFGYLHTKTESPFGISIS